MLPAIRNFERLLIDAGVPVTSPDHGPVGWREIIEEIHNVLASPQRDGFLQNALSIGEQAQSALLFDTAVKSMRLTSSGLPVFRPINGTQAYRFVQQLQATEIDKEDAWAAVPFFSEAAPMAEKKRKVLFLGPNSFREGVWDIRMKYLFPDLYDPLVEDGAQLTMLVPEPPDHAKESLLAFCKERRVRLFRFPSTPGLPRQVAWTLAAEELLSKLGGVDVVTNVQGHTYFGTIFAHLKRLHDVRAVLRVAGDEIMARTFLDTAIKTTTDLIEQLLNEIYIANAADDVIVMSDWEQERLESVVASSGKVVTCHRGVDVEKFRPDVSQGKYSDLRREGRKVVLYLGRKSAEKGYDKVADLAASVNNMDGAGVDFAFAGPGFDVSVYDNRLELGFVDPDDLPNLIAAVDAVILVSSTESLGQVVLEAVACGRICFVEDPKYGRMFRGSDAIVELGEEDAAATVITALREFDATKAERIRDYAATHLDSRKWRKLYKDIILPPAAEEPALLDPELELQA